MADALQTRWVTKPPVGLSFAQRVGMNTRDEWWLLTLLMVSLAFAILPTGLSWDVNRNPDMLEGSWVRRVQWLSLFGIAFAFAIRMRLQALFLYFWLNPFLFLLALYVFASLAWSAFPGIVIRQGIQYFGVLLIAAVCAHWLGQQFTKASWWMLALIEVILVASVLVVVINPEIALETDAGIEGAWRGVVEHKNLLGIVCGVALLLWTAVFTQVKQPAWLAMGGLGLILLCLLQTRSSTSLFFGVTSAGLYLVLYRDHAKAHAFLLRVLLFMALVVLGFVLAFFVFNDRLPGSRDILTPFSALFGKGADLTGRGDIWFYMWQSIASHPWLGLGYASFWLGDGGPSQYISDALRWSIPSAHNGYLDLLNELGGVGFALFTLQLLFHLRNTVWLFRSRRAEAAFHIGLLYIFLVSNFSESQALRVTSFLQMVVFVSMLMVHHAVHAERGVPGQRSAP